MIFIHVFPKQKPKFSELKIDTAKYKVMPEPELPEYSNYDDENEGFEVSVNGEGLVETFIYYWTEKDKKLRCSN